MAVKRGQQRKDDLNRLRRTERAMVRWMCGVTLQERVRMEELMLRLGIEKVEDRVKQGRLRWFGHVEWKEKGDWVSDCRGLKVGERGGRGRRKNES